MSESSMPASGVIPRSVWVSTILICMQSFLQGYIFMALNPTLVMGDKNSQSSCLDGSDSSCPPGSIYQDLALSTLETGLATSLVMLGGLVGCMLAIKPGELYGRKFTLMCNNGVYILGAVLSSLGYKNALFIGRFVSGLSVGCTSALGPTMLSEISQDAYRGTITTCHQVSVTFAILAASLIGYGFVTNMDGGWQVCQALEVLPCLVMLVGYAWVPESPKWLVSVGRVDEALTQLRALRHPGANVEAEVNEITADSKSSAQEATITWKEVMVSRRGVTIACLLMLIQAFTGINSVVFYSTTIFGFAGFKEAILATTAFGVVNFLVTIIACYIIDIYGRKVLLFRGTCVMFVALIALSVALLSPTSTMQGYIAVASVLVYVSGFAVGLGATCWVIMCELVPTRSRSKAMSLFLLINWIGNFFIGLFSLNAINGLGGVSDDMSDDEAADAEKKGVSYLYIIFACVTFVACVYIHFSVPETKGSKPEDFQDSVSAPLITDDSAADQRQSSQSTNSSGNKA